MYSAERKLGSIENLFHIIHHFGGMIDVNIARIEGEIATDILRKVLALLQTRHPMLRVGITEFTDGNYFCSEKITQIPLQVITKTHENQWLEIAEEELHKKFSEQFAPLCRIILLKSSTDNNICEIIASFHHAITDGLSCMTFIDELLFYYDRVSTEENVNPSSFMGLFSPIEQTIDTKKIERNNIQNLQNQYPIEAPTPKLIIETEAAPHQRRTHLLPRIISSEMTSKLIYKCKQQKTTVHGALCAAMLFAAAKISPLEEPIHLSCSSNINLRKYSNPEVNKGYIGCFVSSVESIHSLTENTNFWNLAKECKDRVDSSINEQINNLISENSLADINQQSIQNILENNSTGRIKTINISNRGKFDLAQSYGKLKLKEIYFTVGQHILGPCFWLGALTFHGQLFCSFAHVAPVIKSQTMNIFANYAVDILEKASLEVI